MIRFHVNVLPKEARIKASQPRFYNPKPVHRLYQHDFRYQLDLNKPHGIYVIKPGKENRIRISENARNMDSSTAVAVVCAVTSKRAHYDTSGYDSILQSFPFFTQLLPTFCKTAEKSYSYHLYLAFDRDDPFFTNQNHRKLFLEAFSYAEDVMDCNHLATRVHYVQCRHSGSPTWAQNDAVMEAYLDGMEYFYRLNDDTSLISVNWTTAFIQALDSYLPRNVGITGPNHSGGNRKILTYEFTHKTHIEIFGFYYPRIFPGEC